MLKKGNIVLSKLSSYDYQEFIPDYPVRTIPLAIQIMGCGCANITTTDYCWDGTTRSMEQTAVWQYTISGRGAIEFEGETRSVEPGCAFMVTTPHDHIYYLPEDSDHWEFIYIIFKGNESLRIWKELVKEFGPVAEFGNDSRSVKLAVNIFKVFADDKLRSPLHSSSLAYRMLMQVPEDLSFNLEHKNAIPEPIRKVCDYCTDNLHNPITIDDMAKVAGYSKFHFTRLFTENQGVSPGLFLKELRMTRATNMLQLENLSVKEISERCGYEMPNYFCKVFRQQFGMSPKQYRTGRA